MSVWWTLRFTFPNGSGPWMGVASPLPAQCPCLVFAACRRGFGFLGGRLSLSGLGESFGEGHAEAVRSRRKGNRLLRTPGADHLVAGRMRARVPSASLRDGLAYGMARGVERERHPSVDGSGDGAARRDLGGDGEIEHLAPRHPLKGRPWIRPVEDDVPVLAWIAQQLKHLERELEILDGRNVECRHQQKPVGDVECGQCLVAECCRGVDDDEVVQLLQGEIRSPTRLADTFSATPGSTGASSASSRSL